MEEKKDRLASAMARAAHMLCPGEQTNVSQELLRHAFGSNSVSIEAGAHRLQQMNAIPEQLAYLYALTPEIARYICVEDAQRVQRIRSLEDARQHLLPMYLGLHYECGYLLSMDADGRLLRTEQLRMGSIDEAPFYARIIVETALASGGTYFLLAHNHPAGTKEPSNADIHSTRRALDAMQRMRLTVIDHIIFADGQAISMRESGHMDADMWDRFAPLPKIYENWPG